MSEFTATVHHAVTAIADVFRTKIDGNSQAWEPQNGRTEVVTFTVENQRYPFQATQLTDGTKVVWVPSPDKFDQFVQAEAIKRAIHRGWGGALGGIMFVKEARGSLVLLECMVWGKQKLNFQQPMAA